LGAGLLTAFAACFTIAFLLLQWRTSLIREQNSDWRTSVLEAQAKRAEADLAIAKSDIANADARAASAQADAARAAERASALEADAAKARERTAALEKETTEAKVGIATADARAAEANAHAAQAQLALEKLKMPRTLGPLRQQLVIATIKPFAGQRYRASVSQAADDGIAFWESIYTALEKAGWVYLAMPPGQPAVGNPPAGIPIAAAPGVEIIFDPAKENELTPAALALGNAIHADGTVVAVNRDNHSDPNEAGRDVLMIRIGARVPPQQ
jgi:hypothetical protein